MDGILIVNKPSGITSHDAIDIVRRKFGIRKVGHAGTLDPMATGVLVILIGRATKLSTRFMAGDKEYVAKLFLGKSTDTQDSAGRVTGEKPLDGVSIDFIKKTFSAFHGEILQVPPMVSAKKYKGARLYALARKGKNVARKPCRIKIHDIELLDFNPPEVTFRVRCSKGTYIRTLCEDIGRSLGYPAHMSGLIRTMSGSFSLSHARELADASEKDIMPI